MPKNDLVMLKCYVNREQANKIEAHATEIGMSVSTFLRVLAIEEMRQYAAGVAYVEPITVREELDRR